MKRTEYCELVSQYRKQLYVVAYTILKNEMDAENAVCNGILKGYEHLEQLKDSRKLKSWMTAITKNEALKIKEKRTLLPENEKLEELLEPVHDSYSELWDVSSVDYELMNVSDTTVAIKLVYIDGSEKIIVSHTPDESFIQGGSISYSSEENKVIQQQNLEFTEVLNVADVICCEL